MGRLANFDYTSPFYYMVTIHAKEGAEPFSILSDEAPSGLEKSLVTHRMRNVIFGMNHRWEGRMAIQYFVIMPNHFHLLIRIFESDHRPSLLAIIKALTETLSAAYYEELNLSPGSLIFEHLWHDWIVSKEGMLQIFIDYIKNNPQRALYRRQHPAACFPRSYPSTHYTWTCLGTLSLKETPVRVPVICSRSITPGSDLWEEWKALAQRLGPGCLAVGTFMSPCEKMVREEVLKNGGGIVHLIPHGIGPKGHASAEDEPLLAAGRLSILTPFSYEERTLTKKELHDRCHTILHTLTRGFLQGIDHLPASR